MPEPPVSAAFPGSPKIYKGALVSYPSDKANTKPSAVIAFQYNPESVKRTLAVRAAEGGEGAAKKKEELLAVGGPPTETITLTIELHAADALQDPDRNEVVAEHGLHPALAALEMLLYPTTAAARDQKQKAKGGKTQVASGKVPLVLAVWGDARVMPVKITGFSVSEEAFDTRLNPIHAKVDLSLQVISYVESPDAGISHDAFMSYQKHKEELAGKHTNAADIKIGGTWPGDSRKPA